MAWAKRCVKLASSLLVLVCHVASAEPCGEPDEIGIFKSDEPGYEILVLKWQTRTVKLKVKGRVADSKNEKIITQWVLDRTDEECR